MILLFILFLIIFNVYLKKKEYEIDLFPVIVILLILYAGLKYNYSYDYDNYFIHFNEINTFNDVIHTNFEKGYSILLFIFKTLGLGFNSLLLFIAFLSIKLKTKVINRFSVFPEVSLLIYFLLFYINNDVEQIRHGISIAFCFYSLVFFMKNNNQAKVKSLLLIILAISFHISALLFIPVYFLKDKKINKKVCIAIFIISFALSFINYFNILDYINNNFIHSLYLAEKIKIYANESMNLINTTLIIKTFILSIFYFNVYDSNNKLHRILFNVYFLGIIFTNIFNSIPILAARGTIYMRYMELLMIPLYIKSIENKENKKYHYLILFMIFAYYFIRFFITLINPEYFYYTSI